LARAVNPMERRFLVLYCQPTHRGWPRFWRRAPAPPRRVGLFSGSGRAEAEAERWIARPERGLQSVGWRGVVRAWGWDGPWRDRVMVVEFESEAAALLPDEHLEPEAWMARLDVEHAQAITAQCDGGCFPSCAHCAATESEIEAAWEWLSRHQREVRAWRRMAGAARC
jgi:hypothetical protein